MKKHIFLVVISMVTFNAYGLKIINDYNSYTDLEVGVRAGSSSESAVTVLEPVTLREGDSIELPTVSVTPLRVTLRFDGKEKKFLVSRNINTLNSPDAELVIRLPRPFQGNIIDRMFAETSEVESAVMTLKAGGKDDIVILR